MISKLRKSDLQQAILLAFDQCRRNTLALFEDMDEATFRCQIHPDFSPVGWHLGHIAYTESLWLLERSAGNSCLFPQYRKFFAADGLPKSQRVQLPKLEEIYYYLDTVRKQVLDYLEVADLNQQEPLWRFLLQHESQHCETIAFLLELAKSQESIVNGQESRVNGQESIVNGQESIVKSQESIVKSQESIVNGQESIVKSQESIVNGQESIVNGHPHSSDSFIEIPAGEFEMGSNSIDALDNERPIHQVYLDTYHIDRYPVTCEQYRAFMEAGGYENPRWWSKAGWEWLQIEHVLEPLYWHDVISADNHPVCGVSWYEAEAYCQFVGKRLPTEAEWEKAVSWDADMNCRRIYPWGDKEPTPQHCNCVDLTSPQKNRFINTTPVDAYPEGQSAYGLYDALGNVWEWTASWFDGYDGFQMYPYVGYSQVYFDEEHRVLKGGSSATTPFALRSSFRNWYHPSVRQIFAGFRCVWVPISANFR
ncbi:MAG: SUMF1/EgtB/PvdO family nonheme iron enzyme [Tolypothrix brevis GSE-NOS-MK-07-07A]|nr:SUMF1/EgtB/PvdO family nonheme iron enzyme [Tolypothrix brevis GSE-NOS-MK-07-07A]